MGAYDAIKERGLAIPQDIAVIGFDNQELIAAYLRPKLTTVALPFEEMGALGVQTLAALQQDSRSLPSANGRLSAARTLFSLTANQYRRANPNHPFTFSDEERKEIPIMTQPRFFRAARITAAGLAVGALLLTGCSANQGTTGGTDAAAERAPS